MLWEPIINGVLLPASPTHHNWYCLWLTFTKKKKKDPPTPTPLLSPPLFKVAIPLNRNKWCVHILLMTQDRLQLWKWQWHAQDNIIQLQTDTFFLLLNYVFFFLPNGTPLQHACFDLFINSSEHISHIHPFCCLVHRGYPSRHRSRHNPQNNWIGTHQHTSQKKKKLKDGKPQVEWQGSLSSLSDICSCERKSKDATNSLPQIPQPPLATAFCLMRVRSRACWSRHFHERGLT